MSLCETSFIIKSIEYDLENNLYAQYSSEYDKENLITFTVTIENSENPPRGIAMGRKDAGGDWEVLGEG